MTFPQRASLILLLGGLLHSETGLCGDKLAAVIDGDHRTPGFVARDQYRHPLETLRFLGIRPDMTVVEVWPSQGWYLEILAPYLKDEGVYYGAGFSLEAKRTPEWRRRLQRETEQRLAEQPELYGKIVWTGLSVPEDAVIAPPGSADMVLTFRNVHNWIKGDYAPGVFAAMHGALKPGGILGLVEHRGTEGMSIDEVKQTGYVPESLVIELAEAAGFELIARSEINANPKDSKDWSAGVWTLPPSLRHCSGMEDTDRREACTDKYRAIGESDRMTLKFVKPGD